MSWHDGKSTHVLNAVCGCELAVEVVVPPLSRDEVERDCSDNDPEVESVMITAPCSAHSRMVTP